MYVPWRHLHLVHLSSERPQEGANARLSCIWYPQRVQRMLIRDPEVIRVRLDPAKRDLCALLEVSLRRPRPEVVVLSTG